MKLVEHNGAGGNLCYAMDAFQLEMHLKTIAVR